MAVTAKHRQALGEAVRSARKAAELSQERLAEKSGLSTVFISRIERGKESPTIDSLVKIAHALKIKVHDLITRF
jgi:transcriptional regulator with XRE-family HTH domain